MVARVCDSGDVMQDNSTKTFRPVGVDFARKGRACITTLQAGSTKDGTAKSLILRQQQSSQYASAFLPVVRQAGFKGCCAVLIVMHENTH